MKIIILFSLPATYYSEIRTSALLVLLKEWNTALKLQQHESGISQLETVRYAVRTR